MQLQKDTCITADTVEMEHFLRDCKEEEMQFTADTVARINVYYC